MRRDFVLFVAIFVVFLIFLQLIFLISPSDSNLFLADATNTGVSFCIGYPPVIDFNDCLPEINQSTVIEDNTLYCNINISHPMGHPVFIEPYEVEQEQLYFSLNETGGLVLYGNQSAVGIRGFSINAYDVYEECPFTSEEIYVVRIVDINDPPHMKGILHDVELWEGTERSPFALNEYFDDVDVIYEWKTLIYEALPAGGEGTSNVEVEIDPDTTIVTFRSPSGNCETDELFIKAEDLGGLSVSSNVFQVESLCIERQDVADSDGGGLFEICEPEWRCDVWSECYINGTQVRTCTDINRCNFNDFMKEVWRECDYDAPEAPHVEDIIDPEATCFDGIRNCHVMETGFIICEEGVDCGGPCDPCERLETPGVIRVEETDNFVYVLALMVVLVTFFVTAYLVYKKQIMSLFAALGWWLTRKKRKQFLLKDKDKLSLLRETNNVYSDVYGSDSSEFDRKSKELMRSVRLARKYLSIVLKTIDEFSFEESKKLIDKRILNVSLRRGMYLYSESIFPKEKKTIKISKQELLCFVQETRMLIMITSKLSKNDFNFKATELEAISGKVDKARALIHNSFLALCFSEAISAQSNYFELLKLYDDMNDKEKALVYKELSKIYNYTKTVLSWI